MKKKAAKRIAGLSILNLFFILLCFITLIPILYAFLLSISNESSAFGSGFLLLKNPTLKNYEAILLEEPFLVWEQCYLQWELR
jgi:arabinogalactan oligomer/maltooligosaccharide transport system permease protein